MIHIRHQAGPIAAILLLAIANGIAQAQSKIDGYRDFTVGLSLAEIRAAAEKHCSDVGANQRARDCYDEKVEIVWAWSRNGRVTTVVVVFKGCSSHRLVDLARQHGHGTPLKTGAVAFANFHVLYQCRKKSMGSREKVESVAFHAERLAEAIRRTLAP